MNLTKLLHLAGAGGLVLAMSLFGSGANAREQPAIAGIFRSSILINNPAAADANVSVMLVNADGARAMAAPVMFKVAGSSSTQLYLPNLAGLSDGRYSAVVDSDKPVAVIVNMTSDSPATSTSYNGIPLDAVGRTFNMPQAYKNYHGFTSSLILQNSGAAFANALISYRTGAGQVAAEGRSIAPNASVTVDQGSVAALPQGFVGSAVVTADQDIGAVFLVSAAGQLSSGRGATSGSPIAYAPVIYDEYFGFVTNVFVQNLDTTTTNVTIEYFDSRTGASVGSEQAWILPGTSVTFYQFDTGRGLAVPRHNFNGSAVIRSTDNKNIIAITNINHPGLGYLEAYNAFPSSGATQRASCPAIMKNYHNYNTSLTVQNVGTVPTNLTIQYIGPGGAVASQIMISGLKPNATAFRYNPSPADGLPVGFLGAAVVTSSASPIVAVVNEQLGAGTELGDQLFTYSCSNN